MRSKEPSFVVSFHTTVDAIRFEAKAQKLHFPGRLIPVPRAITAGCGMAWMIRKTQLTETDYFPSGQDCTRGKAEDIIKDLGIPYDRIYDIPC